MPLFTELADRSWASSMIRGNTPYSINAQGALGNSSLNKLRI